MVTHHLPLLYSPVFRIPHDQTRAQVNKAKKKRTLRARALFKKNSPGTGALSTGSGNKPLSRQKNLQEKSRRPTGKEEIALGYGNQYVRLEVSMTRLTSSELMEHIMEG